MCVNQKQKEISDYAKELIRHKARQIIGKVGFTESDREDLEQDMTADLLERLAKFDPTKAAQNTFVARVIERKISNMLRCRKAKKRDYRRVSCSLNDEIGEEDGEPIERAETLSQDDCDIRIGKRRRSLEEQNELRIDISMVLSGFPKDLREIAEHLKYKTVTETARSLGIPRSTVYDSIKRLRLLFEDENLGDYL